MKSLSSMIGWLLLLAVLAVPSFLFYNWWSKNKQQASAEVSAGSVSHNIFPPQDKGAAPAAPAQPVPQPAGAPARSAAQVQAAAQPAAQAADPKAVQEQLPPAAPVQPAVPPRAASRPPSAAAQAPEVPVSSAAVKPAQPPAVSTQTKPSSYFTPKTQRDPMLSPDDYRRIRDQEEARREEDAARRYAESHKPKEPSIMDKISLQGIVGNAAIINGDMYYVGQTFKGVKLVRLGSNYVIMEYKGKTFRKVMK